MSLSFNDLSLGNFLSSFLFSFWLQTSISVLKAFLRLFFSFLGHQKEENWRSSSCNDDVHAKWPLLEIAWMEMEKLFSCCWRNATDESFKPTWRWQPQTKQDWFPLLPLSSTDTLISSHLTQLSLSQPTWSLPLDITSKDPFDAFICHRFYSSESLIMS